MIAPQNPRDAGPAEVTLPTLRQDLRLMRGAVDLTGAPTWLICDPVRHRYFQIGRRAFLLLCEWGAGNLRNIKQRFAVRNDAVDDAEVEAIIRFLHANNLTEQPAQGGASAYLEQRKGTQKSWWHRLAHNYLFFRVPLVRPDGFLNATYPSIAFVYTRAFFACILFAAVLGLYLVARQWDTFTTTFLHFFSPSGFAAYGVALIVVKILHEFAHAYTAVRYGCRVPVMGVAFMVLFPLLYSDVTDAWRLKDRKQRLAIDVSGVAIELTIASIATLAWAFLPDGPARSAAFFLATTSWVLSIFVNLNPFMRFDGYHILADALGAQNLQARGFAFGKWWLREVLFKLDEPVPEIITAWQRAVLITYAYCTWVYRFFLFLGIALLIYHFAFKVLGVLLASIELLFFIGLPIFKELKEWWARRAEIIKTTRSRWTLLGFMGALIVVLVPIPGHLALPALMQSTNLLTIYPPAPAKIVMFDLRDDERVEKGTPLITFHSRQLDHELRETRLRIALLERRLARQAADTVERSNLGIYQNELAAERNRLASIDALKRDLHLAAPFGGVVKVIDKAVQPGDIVGRNAALIQLVDPDQMEIKAFVTETDLMRLSVGSQAVFVPEDPALSRVEARLEEVAEAGDSALALPYFYSTNGGAIAVEESDGEMKPVDAVYQTTFSVGEGGGRFSRARFAWNHPCEG
ncbi:MAG: HlyD family efflux transporter periplasmic adaptor subunit [Pseudomonadota bacterium]